MNRRALVAPLAASLGLALVWACGGAPPPEAPRSEGVPLASSTATAPPAATSAPAPAATSASAPPEAPASASAAAEKKPKIPLRGQSPMAVSEGDKEVKTTIAAGGGKIRVGGQIELYVPAETVEVATNFLLAFNEGATMLKVTPYKGQIGQVYRIGYERPDSSAPSLASVGTPFVVKLPLPKGKTANLVVAVPTEANKAKYIVIAPKSTEEGASGSMAVFEMSRIPASAVLHLTSAPPTTTE